jgi:hypothetical protein
MLKIDQIVELKTGQKVRVIDIDSDPRAAVHGVLSNDPDRSVRFMRNEVK